MARGSGLFDVAAQLREPSAKGEDLELVNALVDFEAFRPEPERAVPRADRAKGGRPPYDEVLMFRILILQASHSLSDERTEYLINGRLSFLPFLGLSLADRVPDRRVPDRDRGQPVGARGAALGRHQPRRASIPAAASAVWPASGTSR